MAGKRLLDAAKLFNVGRSVAKQHLGLRREQWEVYSRTSSLARAIKSQTDKVTVTAGAAYELARRANETGPAWQQQSSRDRQEHGEQAPAQRRRSDAHPSERHDFSSVAASGGGSIATTAATVPPPLAPRQDVDDGTLSSLRKRELQRISERQIPTAAADTQPGLETKEGQDVFSQRPDHTSPELSSLPRAKIPQHGMKSQKNDSHVAIENTNQDVFTSRGT